MTPKQQAQEAHKIAVLFGLLAESTERLAPGSPVSNKIKSKSLEILPLADAFINEVFSIKSVSESTYMTDLMNKVDTVIRKNFQQVK